MLRSFKLSVFCAVLVAALPLASCKRSEPPQVKTLPSGQEIKIVGMKLGHLDGGGRGLFLVYESQLSFDETPEVLAEIREVWSAMKNTATADPDVRYVSITAQSAPRGFLLARRESLEIILHQQRDGSWGGPKPLDEKRPRRR